MATTTSASVSARPLSELRSVASIRTASASLSGTTPGAASPQTPQRQIGTAGTASTYSSPGAYRTTDEECVIVELGARYLRAGLAGEVSPRATIAFGPSEARRVGDYREWLPGYRAPDPARKSTEAWGEGYELWKLDTRGEDIGLVEDRLDRALREAFDRYLLLDSKSRRVALLLPALLPTVYIERALLLLYRTFEVPAVSILPSPAMAVVGAGMRSGLVVDVGWNETVVTAVYELRQVASRRSTRAVKLATLHMARLLSRHGRHSFSGDLEQPDTKATAATATDSDKKEYLAISFEEAEEALLRVGWCQSLADIAEARRSPRPGPGGRQISGSWPADFTPDTTPAQEEDEDEEEQEEGGERKKSRGGRSPEELPFRSFCLPVESALFANGRPPAKLDDEEMPLPRLVYDAMAALPPDVRGACVSRITFVGGGSNLPGLKSRVMDEVAELIARRGGFDRVGGDAADRWRSHLAEISANRRRIAADEASRTRYPANSAGLPAGETPRPIPAGMVMPEIHPIDDKLARDSASRNAKSISGIFRGVESLGAWAGTSLAVASRVRSVVDVAADEFLRDGILGGIVARPGIADSSSGGGAGTNANANAAGTRPRSYITGRDQKGWTLGLWA